MPDLLAPRPWFDRVDGAPVPAVIYHATTPKKLAKYHTTGTILPPVRGFDTLAACQRWARTRKRTITVRVTPSGPVWPLPDHHQPEGLAWWTTRISAFEVLDAAKL